MTHRDFLNERKICLPKKIADVADRSLAAARRRSQNSLVAGEKNAARKFGSHQK
jgi:hypothetical protein